METDLAKESAGKAAADLIVEGMRVGIGTGSTAAYFIRFLSQRCRNGLKIEAIATSKKSWEMALALGIPMREISGLTELDVTVDGADEIDPMKRMIKGGGGALLREKIVANMSREMVVIVDEGKLVDKLGRHPLPVEIVPFAYDATIHKIEEQGYKGEMRKGTSDSLYLTDNHNYIFDVHFDQLRQNPEQDNERIRSIPGVVETGFFFQMAGRIIVGHKDGRVQIRP